MAISIRDVAARAQVSVGTVSNVLNRPDEVAVTTVERVQAAIAELGYIRNPAARQLRAGVSATVGFIVLDGQNPFFNEIVRGAEDEAARHGLAILFGNTDHDPRREAQYVELFEEQHVRGLLVIPTGENADRLAALQERGTTSVLIDRLGAPGRFSSVAIDNIAGGRIAAEHLIATGRRRIAYAGGPFSIRLVDDRLAGARSAIESSGLDAALEVIFTDDLTIDAGRDVGRRIMERPARERPDAMFAANDMVALGLLQVLSAEGRQLVPRDIALIGFDDIPFASAATVPLSSMRQPGRDIGRAALRVLLDEADQPGLIPRQTVYVPELVVRESTARR